VTCCVTSARKLDSTAVGVLQLSMTPTGVDYSKAVRLKLIPYVLYGDPAEVTADARGGPQ
jgi:hypothetical protein